MNTVDVIFSIETPEEVIPARLAFLIEYSIRLALEHEGVAAIVGEPSLFLSTGGLPKRAWPIGKLSPKQLRAVIVAKPIP